MEKYDEKAVGYIKEHIKHEVEKFVGFRGTLEEIKFRFQEIALRDNIIFQAFEEDFGDCDLGFNVNLGEIYGIYFDFEVFVLETRVKGKYLITEIGEF